MATQSRKNTAPLTFDLPLALIAKIDACRRGHAVGSASQVVRLAIGGFDFETCDSTSNSHRQISVRVSLDDRATLKRFAKKKNTSVGELLRYALEAMPTKPGVVDLKRKKI